MGAEHHLGGGRVVAAAVRARVVAVVAPAQRAVELVDPGYCVGAEQRQVGEVSLLAPGVRLVGEVASGRVVGGVRRVLHACHRGMLRWCPGMLCCLRVEQ